MRCHDPIKDIKSHGDYNVSVACNENPKGMVDMGS